MAEEAVGVSLAGAAPVLAPMYSPAREGERYSIMSGQSSRLLVRCKTVAPKSHPHFICHLGYTSSSVFIISIVAFLDENDGLHMQPKHSRKCARSGSSANAMHNRNCMK